MDNRHFSRTEFVSNTQEVILKPVRDRPRKYFLLQNLSGNDIYVNFDTHADINHGFTLSNGQFYERDTNPPQNYMYVSGSQANLQQIQIVEG